MNMENKKLAILYGVGFFALLCIVFSFLFLGIYIGASSNQPSKSQSTQSPTMTAITTNIPTIAPTATPALASKQEYIGKLLPITNDMITALTNIATLSETYDGSYSWKVNMHTALDDIDGVALRMTKLPEPVSEVSDTQKYTQLIAAEIFLFTDDTRTAIDTDNPSYLDLATQHMDNILQYTELATKSIQ